MVCKGRTYDIFNCIKEQCRRHFTLGNKILIDKVMCNDEMIFIWSMLCQIDDSVGNIVLQMSVELYVTVRGFAFTKSCMELCMTKK